MCPKDKTSFYPKEISVPLFGMCVPYYGTAVPNLRMYIPYYGTEIALWFNDFSLWEDTIFATSPNPNLWYRLIN